MRRTFVGCIAPLAAASLALLIGLWISPVDHAAGSASLTRGPYLQGAGQTTMTVVFNLDVAVTGVFRWGRKPGPNFEFSQALPSQTVHAVALANLQPDTRYYYEIEADQAVLATGATYYFDTYPPVNSRKPFTFLAWGDSGSFDANQANVAAQMDRIHPRPAFGLGIGDLIYPNGEAANYNPRYFQPYAPLLRNMVIWPAMGNHDAATMSGQPYLDAFYCPINTGGTPSNTELYYSFDYGMAHFTCLDSQVTYFAGAAARNAMTTWLQNDLDAANTRGARWKIVYFHHPPYAAGTHDSGADAQLIWMRQNLNPIMESRGVDFVLSGHDHTYQRSYLLKNDAALQSDPSDYTKIGTPDGCIYVVSGCGGQIGTGALNHPLMAFSRGDFIGNTVLDVDYDECRGYFVQAGGARLDLFNLRKQLDTVAPRITSARADSLTSLRATYSEPVAAGGGANGAENIANYSLTGGVTISTATLLSDQRTVVLTTSAQAAATAYTLTINNVRDRAAALNTLAANSQVIFCSPAALRVEPGAFWKYHVPTATVMNWFGTGFNDSAWLTGEAGFGYGDNDDATAVANPTVAVYIRKNLQVPNAASVTGMRLYVDYDDGFVAYINGQEVARSASMGGTVGTPPAFNAFAADHECGTWELFDLAAHLNQLVNGNNVLALEIHNVNGSSSDLTLHPRLEIDGGTGANQQPRAVLGCDATTANAPATISFDSAGSSDPDGSIASYSWDFGDGSAAATTPATTHVYGAAGIYFATLTVTDNSGAQAIDQRVIQVVNLGQAPVAQITPSNTAVAPGGTITFDSVGSSDPDGGGVVLFWEFNDPASGMLNFSTATAPQHLFATLGNYDVKLTVTDDEGAQIVARQTITVTNAALTILTTTLPDGNTTSSYNQTLAAGGGTAPYSWAVSGGSLPPGLTLSSSGVVSGSPTSTGTYLFTAMVTDSVSATDTQVLILTINAGGKKKDEEDSGCTSSERNSSVFSALFSLALFLVTSRRMTYSRITR